MSGMKRAVERLMDIVCSDQDDYGFELFMERVNKDPEVKEFVLSILGDNKEIGNE